MVASARELAEANGFADRMEFIRGDSRLIELSERVNVIVSDIRGTLPLFDHAIASGCPHLGTRAIRIQPCEEISFPLKRCGHSHTNSVRARGPKTGRNR